MRSACRCLGGRWDNGKARKFRYLLKWPIGRFINWWAGLNSQEARSAVIENPDVFPERNAFFPEQSLLNLIRINLARDCGQFNRLFAATLISTAGMSEPSRRPTPVTLQRVRSARC
jgi:hypothetical protein